MFAIHSASREFTIKFTWYNIPGGELLRMLDTWKDCYIYKAAEVVPCPISCFFHVILLRIALHRIYLALVTLSINWKAFTFISVAILAMALGESFSKEMTFRDWIAELSLC